MVKCNVCSGGFHDNSDPVVLCAHHKSAIHLECCINNCSSHGAPCEHSLGIYKKE